MFRKQYIRWYFNSLWAYCPPVTHYQMTPAQDDSSASCHICFWRVPTFQLASWHSSEKLGPLCTPSLWDSHYGLMDFFFFNFYLLHVYEGTQHACGIQRRPLVASFHDSVGSGNWTWVIRLLFVCRATLQLLDWWILHAHCVMVYWWSLFCPLASIHFKACLNFSLVSEDVSHSSFNHSSK